MSGNEVIVVKLEMNGNVVRPGDSVLVTMPGASREQVDRIKAEVSRQLGVPVVILAGDVQVAVIRGGGEGE